MIKIELIEKRFGVASGTLFLIFSTLIVKGVGFFYKIPLFNALGSFGMGLYQAVFSVFTLVINLAGAGVPSAMTKVIASGENAEAVLKKSLKIFSVFGLVFFLTTFLLSEVISKIQGNPLAQNLYKVISPSVLIVSVIACFRGYFQGKGRFKPTAISQLIEQLVKTFLGVAFFYFVNGDYLKKSVYACLAITLSEVIALIYFLFAYTLEKNKRLGGLLSVEKKVSFKPVFKLFIGLTAVTLALPIGGFIDGVTIVNALSFYTSKTAVNLYGIYAGGIQTLIALPVSLLHVIAVGCLPKLSRNGGNLGTRLLFYTTILSAIFFIGFQIFPTVVQKILFNAFEEYQAVIIKLIKISAINVIFLSTLSASNTVLLANNKQYFSVISMFVGLAFKTVLNLVIIKIPSINIFGAVFSDFAFYAVALALNLLKIYGVKNKVFKLTPKLKKSV